MDEAWMKFMETGKIDDYLHYRSGDVERMNRSDIRSPQEERPDGTEYRSDRDGLTGYADWRI